MLLLSLNRSTSGGDRLMKKYKIRIDELAGTIEICKLINALELVYSGEDKDLDKKDIKNWCVEDKSWIGADVYDDV